MAHGPQSRVREWWGFAFGFPEKASVGGRNDRIRQLNGSGQQKQHIIHHRTGVIMIYRQLFQPRQPSHCPKWRGHWHPPIEWDRSLGPCGRP